MVTAPIVIKARWIYLRGLGFCFACTFVSLLIQIRGLIGGEGIFPVAETLATTSFWKAPSLLWLNASDAVLVLLCVLGLAGALAVVADRWTRLGFFLCWASFLSLASVMPQFTWYKADSLLLEAAVLAWFLASKSPPTRTVLYAHVWLLFRLMLETGLTKLFSPDSAWKDLSAMSYFHETMPFPTWVGWFLAKLPFAVHKAETVLTLASEIVAPILLLCGYRARVVACLVWCALQAGILVSGNFLAFNYQSIFLGLLLIVPFEAMKAPAREFRHGLVLVPHALIGLALLWSFPFYPNLPLPQAIRKVTEAVEPFRSANAYILYPFIERERRIVVLEGSDDGGKTWREYGHRWQTQRLDRAPRFLSPLSDRFERELKHIVEPPGALPYWQNPLLFNMASRLLLGSAPVKRLFAEDPFPNSPPQRLRATVYRYQSTDLRTWVATGEWWTRRKLKAYCPDIVRDPVSGRIDYDDYGLPPPQH